MTRKTTTMNKADALAIFATAIVRELLREPVYEDDVVPAAARLQPEPEDPNPHPQFDFDESTCTHGGLVIDRSICPIHGPDAMGPPPTAEELDDITGETADEGNPLIAKARRLKEQRERKERTQRLYPEDLPMSGLGPPIPDDVPPPVV
jgi:hypothetical protein